MSRVVTGDGSAGGYRDLVARFQRLVIRAVPRDAAVLVVSKGDDELVSLDGRHGWHFPQRSDGIYAGHHPDDSAAAISHLDALRERGADFLAIPAPSLWWLDHYPEFREHIETRYRLVVENPEVGFVYTLFDVRNPTSRPPHRSTGAYGPPPPTRRSALDALEALDERTRETVHALVDVEFYSARSGRQFRSVEEALLHYMEEGATVGLDPHPLFDTPYYLAKNPDVRVTGINPLIHFARYAPERLQDPNRYFDTAYYYFQGPGLRTSGANALVHYVQNANANMAYAPNPLFGNGYYLTAYPDVRAAGMNPLAHYLRDGWREGRFASHHHQTMVEELRRSARSALLRGNWKDGSVLLFASQGREGDELSLLARVASVLAAEHHLEATLVVLRGGPRIQAGDAKVLVLEDYTTAKDVLRPSALRMLAKTLVAGQPLFALTDVPDVLEGLADAAVPSYFVAFGTEDSEGLQAAVTLARRLLFTSSRAFENAGEQLGVYPTDVALRPAPAATSRPEGGTHREEYVQSLLELAERDFGLEPRTSAAVGSSRGGARKIVIPCSDWTVSGVNASLEAVGAQLVERGWDVEVVFTRDKEFVLETAHDEAHLPRLPYRFLERRNRGVEGMWEALVAYLEQSAPCIVFMAYDFIANSVVPALTDDVAAVAWVQADDGDYYEQAYRLGRYCNSVVCVSEHIRERVAGLNPAIAERAVVIHNSSVSEREVVARRRRRRRQMRLVYTGRLVQYQKRILDFVDLADALDERTVPYTITLIGAFSRHESIRDEFHARAKAHLDDGRIRLLGRLSRERILEQLTDEDFFVLLSDFEGLPLSLVEAMARGCVPVVARTESGIPELITSGENGLVIPGRDYGEWAEELVRLWRDRAVYAAMSARAAETVRERFTIERVAGQFDELFARVADELETGSYTRPPPLHWGEKRSLTGDVLPPPSLYRPVLLAGLR